jgi:hypothetical protein
MAFYSKDGLNAFGKTTDIDKVKPRGGLFLPNQSAFGVMGFGRGEVCGFYCGNLRIDGK